MRASTWRNPFVTGDSESGIKFLESLYRHHPLTFFIFIACFILITYLFYRYLMKKLQE